VLPRFTIPECAWCLNALLNPSPCSKTCGTGVLQLFHLGRGSIIITQTRANIISRPLRYNHLRVGHTRRIQIYWTLQTQKYLVYIFSNFYHGLWCKINVNFLYDKHTTQQYTETPLQDNKFIATFTGRQTQIFCSKINKQPFDLWICKINRQPLIKVRIFKITKLPFDLGICKKEIDNPLINRCNAYVSGKNLK
jgi:hypothetical protein